MNRAAIDSLAKLLAAEAPDVVFTHWPVDTHADHQVAGALTYQAYLRAGRTYPLYFYEVETEIQTMAFAPTDYVDITDVHQRKLAALYAHRSQNPDEIYRGHHKLMEEFRGREAGVPRAEAFVRLAHAAAAVPLPGLLPERR